MSILQYILEHSEETRLGNLDFHFGNFSRKVNSHTATYVQSNYQIEIWSGYFRALSVKFGVKIKMEIVLLLALFCGC